MKPFRSVGEEFTTEKVRPDASGKVKPGEETTVRIGELAHKTGASPRALRHYEERGLLVPERTSGGYRDYGSDDILRVAHIKTMIDAGLTTTAVRRYLDCARSGDRGTWLELCPNLRAELDSVAESLHTRQTELHERQQRLQALFRQ